MMAFEFEWFWLLCIQNDQVTYSKRDHLGKIPRHSFVFPLAFWLTSFRFCTIMEYIFGSFFSMKDDGSVAIFCGICCLA